MFMEVNDSFIMTSQSGSSLYLDKFSSSKPFASSYVPLGTTFKEALFGLNPMFPFILSKANFKSLEIVLVTSLSWSLFLLK